MPKRKSKKSNAFSKRAMKALSIQEKPKRRVRKPKDTALVKEYYERKTIIVNPQSGVEHKVFTGVKPCQQVNEMTQIGTRVLVARHPNFYKLYLYSFHKPGEPTFPRGGVKIWNATDAQMQYFYTESVAIHPEGGHHQFSGVTEIDVDNLDVSDDNKEESMPIE